MVVKRMTKADHPQSFGAFKPVGHIVVALPDDARAAQAVAGLHALGFAPEDILEYTAAEENDEMDRMLARTSEVAGFGHEVTLMRRYQELARNGASWLIVWAPDEKKDEAVVELLRRHGALLAERYGRLVIEDLL
jgi:hypothetical protein